MNVEQHCRPFNKSVSYRIHIARQHSCRKIFLVRASRGRPCKHFPLIELIAVQSLVAVCYMVQWCGHIVSAYVGGPRNVEIPPMHPHLGGAWLSSYRSTPLPTCYRAEFGRSITGYERSYGENWVSRPPFQGHALKVIGTDIDRLPVTYSDPQV